MLTERREKEKEIAEREREREVVRKQASDLNEWEKGGVFRELRGK